MQQTTECIQIFFPMKRVDLSSNSVSQTSSVQSSCPRKKHIFQSISCVSGSIRWSHIITLAVYYICPILSYDMFMKSLLEYDRLKWSKHNAWPLKDYIPIINAIDRGGFRRTHIMCFWYQIICHILSCHIIFYDSITNQYISYHIHIHIHTHITSSCLYMKYLPSIQPPLYPFHLTTQYIPSFLRSTLGFPTILRLRTQAIGATSRSSWTALAPTKSGDVWCF